MPRMATPGYADSLMRLSWQCAASALSTSSVRHRAVSCVHTLSGAPLAEMEDLCSKALTRSEYGTGSRVVMLSNLSCLHMFPQERLWR